MKFPKMNLNFTSNLLEVRIAKNLPTNLCQVFAWFKSAYNVS